MTFVSKIFNCQNNVQQEPTGIGKYHICPFEKINGNWRNGKLLSLWFLSIEVERATVLLSSLTIHVADLGAFNLTSTAHVNTLSPLTLTPLSVCVWLHHLLVRRLLFKEPMHKIRAGHPVQCWGSVILLEVLSFGRDIKWKLCPPFPLNSKYPMVLLKKKREGSSWSHGGYLLTTDLQVWSDHCPLLFVGLTLRLSHLLHSSAFLQWPTRSWGQWDVLGLGGVRD